MNNENGRGTWTLLAALVASAMCAVGCSGNADDVRAETVAEGGGELVVDVSTPSLARGRFTVGDARIAFELARKGSDRTATITDARGAPLLTVVLRDDGSRTLHMLGARLVIEMGTSGEPTYSGEREAEASLRSLPEAACLDMLDAGLARAAIDPSLLPTRPQDRAGLGPASTPYVVAEDCGEWINPQVHSFCGTKFFGSTKIVARNCAWSSKRVFFDGTLVYVPAKQTIAWLGGIAVCGTVTREKWYGGRDVPFFNDSDVSIYYGH